ncbi:MAG: PASTA domain-containing protein [Duncaniella sp.]|nr:PASTA domain-containing protein [Duncaniella sp.]
MKKILLNVLGMVAAFFVVLWLTSLWLDSWTRHGDTITVPSVRSLSYSEALDALHAEGLVGCISDSVYDSRTAPGTVIEQNPKVGTVVKEGREVFLVINALSPKTVTLPALTDISLRQARSILDGLDIKNVTVRTVPSDFKDLVLSVLYNGTRVSAGARVPVTANIVLEVGEGAPEIFSDSIPDSTDATTPSDHLDLF